MIRFKTISAPCHDVDADVHRYLDQTRRRDAYKRVLKASQGADRRKLASDMVALDRLCRSTAKVPTPLVEFEEIAKLAGRVEREARKLKSAQEVRRLERQLVKDGLATYVKKGRPS